ncbi:LCP family protein [Bacillus sp. V5-8f]|uniref:LCP family protein n=1 Tax=Bacillus sp. V5-8f TaxID=2053044 RepID=UPI000C7946E4|nr:LCP family protein [Bacillus sp. V5-8f]PLT34983.1 transcriptional regulator [Bacillus sp. V5-8f]
MRLRIFVIFAYLLIITSCSKLPVDDKTKQEESNVVYPEQVAGADSEGHLKREKIYLLLGTDSRGEPDSRSDAILLARYDSAGNKMKLASIMRDSYVKIPGYKNGFNKINMAYYLGGSELLKQTIYENFDIKPDHVVTIDFDGFIQLVDLLAPEGIKVDVKPEMIEDMSIETVQGKQTLHGEGILKYVRFRHDSESDFGRVKRQQEVLVQLKDVMSERLYSVNGIISMPYIMKEAIALTETDMGLKEIAELGSTVLFHPVQHVSTLRIPIKGSFSDQSFPHSGAVLKMNQKENSRALREFFGKEEEDM